MQDSYAVQATILGLIGRRAAERITTQALAGLADVHRQMGEAVELGERDDARLNRAFHRVMRRDEPVGRGRAGPEGGRRGLP
jgi:DNA-binding GntR family transcriptional regulator